MSLTSFAAILFVTVTRIFKAAFAADDRGRERSIDVFVLICLINDLFFDELFHIFKQNALRLKEERSFDNIRLIDLDHCDVSILPQISNMKRYCYKQEQQADTPKLFESKQKVYSASSSEVRSVMGSDVSSRRATLITPIPKRIQGIYRSGTYSVARVRTPIAKVASCTHMVLDRYQAFMSIYYSAAILSRKRSRRAMISAFFDA